MNPPVSAVEDTNWLEPQELYLHRGSACEFDRPIFQGDVFGGVPFPVMPLSPPLPGRAEFDVVESLVMLVPHPCQCYQGDNLRKRLTVAPVTEVASYGDFGRDRTGAKDKFALLDLPVVREGREEYLSHVADFGRLVTIPNGYLRLDRRIACLSHLGLGLLAKRLLQYQLRAPSTLANTLAYTYKQWNEAFAMQAWIRKYGSLKGFSDWTRSPQVFPSIDPVTPMTPGAILAGALEVVLEAITGAPVE